jgi:hypothetical protein
VEVLLVVSKLPNALANPLKHSHSLVVPLKAVKVVPNLPDSNNKFRATHSSNSHLIITLDCLNNHCKINLLCHSKYKIIQALCLKSLRVKAKSELSQLKRQTLATTIIQPSCLHCQVAFNHTYNLIHPL